MADQPTIIRDGRGRTLEVRRWSIREARRFTRAMGRAADIDRWFGEAVVAAQVRGIAGADGAMAPVIMPDNPERADDLVEKLGPEGLLAAANWLNEQPAPDPKEELHRVGESLGTPT